MYGNLGEGIARLYVAMITLIVLFVPLGIWKAYELATEFFSHISWN